MDYQAQALQTKSDKFYGEKVSKYWLMTVLAAVSAGGEHLDKIKKALFYGKDLSMSQSGEKCDDIAKFHPNGIDIVHSIIGKITEAAELADLLISVIDKGAQFDSVNFKEEIGDGKWYDAIGLAAIDVTDEECEETNIAKLRARFPNKFTEYDAQNRDLVTERNILEK